MKIKLIGFQLFKSAEFTLGKLNAITGTNLDNLKNSSNGSGKSTLCKNAITFCLYGDIPGLSLDKIIHDDEKECSVTIECSHNSKQYQIIRKIPTSLQIFENGIEVQLNSIPLKQAWIDRVFGDYIYFKKFRLIDLRGTNLLDNLNDSRSIVTLKKELMSFVDDLFIVWRNGLLKKKTERETYNKDRRHYKFHLSDRRLKVLEDGLKRVTEEMNIAWKEKDKQYQLLNNIKSEIRTKENIISSKQNEIKQAKEGICPILRTHCEKISKSLGDNEKNKNLEINKEVTLLTKEKEVLLGNLTEEQSNDYHEVNYLALKSKVDKTNNFIMKLKEAFKFSEYKFTAKDVMMYTESVKVLDDFSSYYINEWLGELAIIVNDLLKNVNITIEFTEEKEFMRVMDNGKAKVYAQLSSGQKTFLSAVFKLAILIHKGETEGLILCDEGFDFMDEANLENFIEVVQPLNFQIVFVYQDLPEMEGINRIDVLRQNNESKIQ
jgi:hypothetical protein